MNELDQSGLRSPWLVLAAWVLPGEPAWRAADAARRRRLRVLAGDVPLLGPADVARPPRPRRCEAAVRRRRAAWLHRAPSRLHRARRR
jgi:hypothetical protein